MLNSRLWDIVHAEEHPKILGPSDHVDLRALKRFRSFEAQYRKTMGSMPRNLCKHNRRKAHGSWQCCNGHRNLSFLNSMRHTLARQAHYSEEYGELSAMWYYRVGLPEMADPIGGACCDDVTPLPRS